MNDDWKVIFEYRINDIIWVIFVVIIFQRTIFSIKNFHAAAVQNFYVEFK